ncbi:hypothetical protein [Novosphingobium mangrovi (ex Hu et al. 2023)]|uniref:Tetratricopeptide repeat protein n=1 Tax=Novosphingobium mangrovi (ex Hu et al. 2023) TaxID=2930094 RepID=A0ABT0AFX9_9SPHN|nr:hypothetical protein [Novosphingobium mangrovi (ex Hu et al. 2023)]MCJ1962113.1 hypothetical protein [Novosphingobium mangrovi (ex Hu et al. 2023)]
MRAYYGTLLSITAAIALSAASTGGVESKFSAAQISALDPTVASRSICRGGRDSAATLQTRLRLADDLSQQRHLTQERTELYAGLAPTDLPAPELQGLAARYFAQGLALAYGFNHKAAIRSFRMAQEAAPDCALCFWGEAMANGPNINAGMNADENGAALRALEKAEALSSTASPVARALIQAQALRYSDGNGDRKGLDEAYAAAMQDVASRFPESDDIAVLAAEAAMNTTPWDYWEAADKPRPQIAGAIDLIEKVSTRNPQHPQASHLYVHLMEASQPAKAEAAADRLAAGAAPGSLGHLVHMPAHIYYRVGRYADSMRANVAAVRADEAYLAQAGDDGLYRYGYYPHNVHFLLTSAQMVGDMRRVVTEADRLTRILDVETARQLPWVQAIHAAPAFAIAQFGSPEAIMATTQERSPLPYVEAMRQYARATAAAQTGNSQAFAKHVAAILTQAGSPEITAMVDAGFPAPELLQLAALVARARWEHWQGSPAKAVALYEQAEAIEATIPYNEPPYWYFPIAHSRGAALYATGQFEAARMAFRKALVMAPNNGWALYGLAQTEARLGHELEAAAAAVALEKIWLGERAWLNMTRL